MIEPTIQIVEAMLRLPHMAGPDRAACEAYLAGGSNRDHALMRDLIQSRYAELLAAGALD